MSSIVMISTQCFQDKGYQIFRNAVRQDKVLSQRAFLERRLDQAFDVIQRFGLSRKSPSLAEDIRTILAAPDAATIDREVRSTLTGHFPLNVRLERMLWMVPQDDNIQQILRAVLKSTSLRMHMPPTARFVLPGNAEAGVPAHQDVSYNRHMTGFVTMWVPLVEIDSLCGGVTVFEGSDKAEAATATANNGIWNEAIPTNEFDEIDCVPMFPGDVDEYAGRLAGEAVERR